MNLWLIPVGAAIGYLTNYLALKMIFRPKRPVRIGPFTLQGVIYKKRDRIARSLAEGIHRVLPWWLNLPVVAGAVRRGLEDNLGSHSAEDLEKLLYDVARREIRMIEAYGALIGAAITALVTVIA